MSLNRVPKCTTLAEIEQEANQILAEYNAQRDTPQELFRGIRMVLATMQCHCLVAFFCVIFNLRFACKFRRDARGDLQHPRARTQGFVFHSAPSQAYKQKSFTPCCSTSCRPRPTAICATSSASSALHRRESVRCILVCNLDSSTKMESTKAWRTFATSCINSARHCSVACLASPHG